MLSLRQATLALALCAVPTPGAHGQEPAHPQFRDFPVASVFRGRPAAVDLSSDPLARQYRSRLRAEAPKGPNFAGHYTIVRWGCGTDCFGFAIMDAQNGRVLFLRPEFSIDLDYRLDSSLLIIDPPEAWCSHFGNLADEQHGMSRYYRWAENKLVFLDSLAAPPCPKQPNQRLKLSGRGGRLVGKVSPLIAAAPARSLSAIR